MYSLDINFLNDRPEYRPDGGTAAAKSKQPTATNAPLILGLVIGVALPALAMGALLVLQNNNSTLETEKAKLDQELSKLQAALQEADKLNTEAAAIKAETDALASVFTKIKPWSAMLEDLSRRIPATVQINNLQEAGGVITMTGTGRSYNDVNDFVLSLQKSPFLVPAETRLTGTQMSAYPGNVQFRQGTSSVFQIPQVASFSIQTKLNDIAANELVRELDRNGAVGLVTRLRTLQEKGVIQ